MEHNPPKNFRRGIVLSGDVAYFHFVMNFYSSEEESRTLSLVTEIGRGLQEEMNKTAKDVLGRDFEIRTMTVGKGSLELFIVLAATGTVYMGFSRYKNFIESLELLKSQIEGVLRRSMPSVVRMDGSVVPGLALFEAGVPVGSTEQNSSNLTQMILLIYVVSSHAALLVMTLWILFKKVFS